MTNDSPSVRLPSASVRFPSAINGSPSVRVPSVTLCLRPWNLGSSAIGKGTCNIHEATGKICNDKKSHCTYQKVTSHTDYQVNHLSTQSVPSFNMHRLTDQTRKGTECDKKGTCTQSVPPFNMHLLTDRTRKGTECDWKGILNFYIWQTIRYFGTTVNCRNFLLTWMEVADLIIKAW